MVNLFVCMPGMDGNADFVPGQYVLTSHGQVLAHLTAREYHLHRALEVRMFSGIWLLFYVISAIGLLFWRETEAKPGNLLE
jgi:hypothetical protein